MPIGQYLDVIDYQLGHESKGHWAFLLGQISKGGWWYYFPIAFLVKTPLPLLILLGLAIARGRFSRDESYLALAAGVYLAAAMVQALNIGVRHILPIYPLVIILAARTVGLPWPKTQQRWGNAAVAALLVWMVVETIAYSPQYLPYFNELVGGPVGGRRVLVDSNLDWGQDLHRLTAWQREHPEAKPLHLAYFGAADPRQYGVSAEPLPGWCRLWPDKTLSSEERAQLSVPRKGWIAVSVNCLTFQPRYRWLNSYQPVGRAGHSILIYHIANH